MTETALYSVKYLPDAEQDLVEILAYGIETWGEAQAEATLHTMVAHIETLCVYPYRTQAKGRLGTRELLLCNGLYRAIILIDESLKVVNILRIWHSAQLG